MVYSNRLQILLSPSHNDSTWSLIVFVASRYNPELYLLLLDFVGLLVLVDEDSLSDYISYHLAAH